MKKLLRLLAIAGPLAGCNVVPSLQVTPRYGPLDVDGELVVSSSSATGRSTADDLGIDAENVLQPRVELSWGPADVSATGLRADFEGEGVAQGMLDLGGVVISGGEPVATRLDLGVLSAAATWDLVPTGLLDFGVGLGAAAVDFDASFRSLSSGETVRSSDVFVIPVLAARAQTEVGPFRANLQWSGLMGEYDGVKANYHDLDLYGEYTWLTVLGVHGALGVGYRILITDVEYDEQGSRVDAELDFSGFYFGLTLGV